MHEEDLDAVLAAHAARLAAGGVLVCEFFHALAMVEGTSSTRFVTATSAI
jgi:hypothetical protein